MFLRMFLFLNISNYSNPDDTAKGDKIIFEDDWTKKKLTYSGLRDQSARGAFGLRRLLSLHEADVVAICAPKFRRWKVYHSFSLQEN